MIDIICSQPRSLKSFYHSAKVPKCQSAKVPKENEINRAIKTFISMINALKSNQKYFFRKAISRLLVIRTNTEVFSTICNNQKRYDYPLSLPITVIIFQPVVDMMDE